METYGYLVEAGEEFARRREGVFEGKVGMMDEVDAVDGGEPKH